MAGNQDYSWLLSLLGSAAGGAAGGAGMGMGMGGDPTGGAMGMQAMDGTGAAAGMPQLQGGVPESGLPQTLPAMQAAQAQYGGPAPGAGGLPQIPNQYPPTADPQWNTPSPPGGIFHRLHDWASQPQNPDVSRTLMPDGRNNTVPPGTAPGQPLSMGDLPPGPEMAPLPQGTPTNGDAMAALMAKGMGGIAPAAAGAKPAAMGDSPLARMMQPGQATGHAAPYIGRRWWTPGGGQ